MPYCGFIWISRSSAVLPEAIDLNGFGYLHIEPKHTALLTTMVAHHNDPFDRLLVAQALSEGMPIVSADAQLDAYGINRLW